MRNSARTAFLVVGVLVTAWRPSHSFRINPSPFVPDTTLRHSDSIPPAAPVIHVKGIWRGEGVTYLDGGLVARNSEGDHGSIAIEISTASDSTINREDIGYLYHFVDGTFPKSFALPDGAWKANPWTSQVLIELDWDDGGTWQQDAFSFRMFVTAIDRAGNESAPSNIVTASHDGRTEKAFEQQPGTCSVVHLQGVWTGKDERGAKAEVTINGRQFVAVSRDATVAGFLQLWIDEKDRQHIVIDRGEEVPLSGPFEPGRDQLQFWLSAPNAANYYKHYDVRRQRKR